MCFEDRFVETLFHVPLNTFVFSVNYFAVSVLNPLNIYWLLNTSFFIIPVKSANYSGLIEAVFVLLVTKRVGYTAR